MGRKTEDRVSPNRNVQKYSQKTGNRERKTP
jgi:hypothetical protein